MPKVHKADKVRTWNRHLYPPGGYIFIDAENISHKGKDILDLVSEIARYRLRRELPPGNPVVEVNEYLCARWPSRCHYSVVPSEAVLARTRANTVMAGVSLWLKETWRAIASRRMGWVSEKVTQSRVEICLKCPKHEKVGHDCPVCEESLNQVSFQLRAGRDQSSRQLSICTHYQTDARVDVLLEQPKDPGAPDNCWKRPVPEDL